MLVDGIFAGAAFPFPVIYSGGINPVLWRPIVGLHSLNIPPLSFDLTPFVGVMDDGLLPEAGEVRGVMAQMEALLELLEGKTPRKAKEVDA